MQRFKKYAIGAGGMLVLVAAIVLATGSGSAVAAQITSVFVTNDAAHPVPVHEQGTASVTVTNLPANQAVNGTVNVGNLPAAPTTEVVANTSGHVDAFGAYIPLPRTDVSKYRSVSLFLTLSAVGSSGEDCAVETFDSHNHGYVIDTFNTGDNVNFTRSYDPAPPNLFVSCVEDSGQALDYNFMLAGRTG
jgi:hypothetical protein